MTIKSFLSLFILSAFLVPFGASAPVPPCTSVVKTIVNICRHGPARNTLTDPIDKARECVSSSLAASPTRLPSAWVVQAEIKKTQPCSEQGKTANTLKYTRVQSFGKNLPVQIPPQVQKYLSGKQEVANGQGNTYLPSFRMTPGAQGVDESQGGKTTLDFADSLPKTNNGRQPEA